MALFKRIQLLWKETGTTRDGAPEPSEAKFRTLLLTVLMLVGPPLLLFVYFKTMFPGLTNPDALDYAQLGRNLSGGHGFVTSILRPLALTHGSNPLAQPDVTHGPLFPFLLALSFGVLGAKDTTVAIVSGLFYLLTVPVLYRLGVRVFSRAVGLLAALIFVFNALMLEYASSGLPITLYVFLMTCLLLVVFNIATVSRHADPKLPRSQYVLAGVLMALLFLTEPLFFWVVPFLVGALYALTPGRKMPGMLALLAPMALLMLPWMMRNMTLTGNPIFGLRGTEIWMNTKGHYPGYTAYRQFPADIIPGVEVFKAVVQKLLLGAGQIIQAFPQVTASWVLAFFLPCLLFRFTDTATNALRRVMMLCLLGLFVGSLVFRVQMPLFVAIIPTMLIFSVAYLLHLTQQAKLNRASLVLVTSLMAAAIGFPLLSDMLLIEKTQGLKEAGTARMLGKAMQRDEVALSDQPWIVAWYADRPAIWVPMIDVKIGDIRKQFPKTRWLFLTDNTRTLSPQWDAIYNVFARWDNAYTQALAEKKTLNSFSLGGKAFPLLEALSGFTAVAPAKDAATSVVIAAVPMAEQKVEMRAEPGGAVQR